MDGSRKAGRERALANYMAQVVWTRAELRPGCVNLLKELAGWQLLQWGSAERGGCLARADPVVAQRVIAIALLLLLVFGHRSQFEAKRVKQEAQNS